MSVFQLYAYAYESIQDEVSLTSVQMYWLHEPVSCHMFFLSTLVSDILSLPVMWQT
jgi:hypothetical protein